MVAPTVRGTTSAKFSSATTWSITVTGLVDGDWILATLSHSSLQRPAPPVGWEAILPPTVFGTRRATIYGKIWHTGDSTTISVPLSASATGTIGVIWGYGGPTRIDSFVPGFRALRGEWGSSSTSFTNIARSITTTVPDTLVLAYSLEASNAVESPDSIASSTGGFTQVQYVAQGPTVSVGIETIWVGSKVMATPGATGDNLITHRSDATANGIGLQIAIPPTDRVIPKYTISTARLKSSSGTELGIPKPMGLVDGDLLIVGATQSGNPITVTDSAAKGWWPLGSATFGTRSYSVHARLYSSSMPDSDWYLTFSGSAGATVTAGAIRDHKVVTVSDLVVGTPWGRPVSGPTVTLPSITTPTADYLAIGWAGEATSALNTTWSQTTGDFTFWESHPDGNLIETAQLSYKLMPTAGATGDSVLTYNSGSANGWGMQIGVPLKPSGPEVIAAPYVVSSTEGSAINSGTGVTIPTPTGLQVGDALVAIIRCQNVSATSDFVPPAGGWTRIGPPFPGPMPSRHNTQFMKIVSDPASEPENYTFARSVSDSQRRVAQIVQLRAADGVPTISSYWPGTSNLDPAGSIDSAADAYTISGPASTIYWADAEFTAGQSSTISETPVGYTDIRQATTAGTVDVSRTSLYTAWRQWTSGTSTTGLVGVNWLDTPSGPMAGSLSFTTGPMPNFMGEGLPAKNGAGGDTRVYVMTAAGPRTPSSIVPMRRGFNSVTEMISTHGATWGHRGASGIKPECSLAGYTYAVARGYGALEISLARTSDGVWFGLHDQYLDRVALGVSTMTLDPKLMTWAQVQSYTNIDGYGAPVPFLRWEEYVATYGADVVTIVDPKYALSYKAEFLAMVTRDIGPSRAIIKYSGPGTNSGALSTDARAMGYQTWGFFYIADASTANGGNNYIQTYANNWTLLGMEHGASQAIWDEILAFGKPVYGHIAGTQAYYDTAMAKGASGVQCSGVQVINPVSWWNTTASGAGVFTATYQSSY